MFQRPHLREVRIWSGLSSGCYVWSLSPETLYRALFIFLRTRKRFRYHFFLYCDLRHLKEMFRQYWNLAKSGRHPDEDKIKMATVVGSWQHITFLSSVQFSSVSQLCPTFWDPMNCIMPGLPVHHQLPEFTQTHVHRVSDAIQPSHPLTSPSPPAPNPSQHQSLFQ